MNNENFEKAIKRHISIIEGNLLDKAREYASDVDRLHNFTQGARIENQVTERVIWGIALKHLISVKDIIHNIENGIVPTQEFLDEKLGDWATYMALLYASIQDKINNETK